VTHRVSTEILLEIEEERERQYRRWLLVSAAAHVALAVVFLVSPRSGSRVALPGVVRVDLVAAAPARPAPAPVKAPAKPAPPKPAPKPVPKPPPPPPVPEKKVLPTEPTAPKPKPKPEPRAEPAAEPAPAEPEPDYEDVMAQLREQAGEDAPSPAAAAVPGPGGRAAAGGGDVIVSPEELAWMRRAKAHVTQAWVLAPGFRAQPLEAEVEVRVGPTGEVLDVRLSRRSGNPWFDESVERAVRKASPLPPPPEADEWPFVFRPQDLL